MIDENGSVVWSADYEPFGEAEITVNTMTNNFRFPGQYYDGETGLHYNWHRYYDPGIGRYFGADPIGLESGINLYAYVQNDPINSNDPLGLQSGAPTAPGLPLFPPILPPVFYPGTPENDAFVRDVNKIINWLFDDDECEDKEEVCQERYDTDIATCRTIGRRRGKAAAARCYKTAADRYAACLKGQPLPPLDVWNN
jgi:RHS repeat-associated protein